MSQPQTRQLDDWNNMECTFCGLFVWWFGREIGAKSPKLSAPKLFWEGSQLLIHHWQKSQRSDGCGNIVEHRYLARTIVSIQNPWSPVGEYVMFSPSWSPFQWWKPPPFVVHPSADDLLCFMQILHKPLTRKVKRKTKHGRLRLDSFCCTIFCHMYPCCWCSCRSYVISLVYLLASLLFHDCHDCHDFPLSGDFGHNNLTNYKV